MRKSDPMQIILQLKLPAKLENLRYLVESVSRGAKEQGFDSEKVNDLSLATEEALVNIFSYAYQGDIGDVDLTCVVDDDNRFIVEIADCGVPFNGFSLGDPDTEADVAERKIGGLGVFLIKKFVDDVQYRRDTNKNILKLIILPTS